MARDCLGELRLDADVSQYTTTVAAGDVEALRQALGAPKLNLYGGSYGTRMAQEYARRYPDARAQHHPGRRGAARAGAGQRTRHQPRGRAQAHPRPVRRPARLQQGLRRSVATLHALLDQARDAPVPVAMRDPVSHAARDVRLDEGTVALIARLFAYAPETAALLPLLLDEAPRAGRSRCWRRRALVLRFAHRPDHHGMQLSVVCAEDAPRMQARPEDDDLVLGDSLVSVTLNQCSVWPKGPVSKDFHQPLATDIPTLLLSGEFDPVTPPRYGDQVLASLGKARHLVGTGQGHILLARGCTPRLAAEFVDKLDPKGAGRQVPGAAGRHALLHQLQRSRAMIELRDLRKTFGNVKAVDGVSFTANDGQITGLLGPNGAGKTTTLRMLYTLMKPDTGPGAGGRHRRQHRPAGGAPPARRAARLARPVQAPDSRENIRYFGRLHGLDDALIAQRTDALIASLDMDDIVDRRTEGFSHGQRVKTAIARALVHDPRNVLLDEPTNGLDVMATRAMRRFLHQLRDEGRCVLFSSHIMQEVAALCDRIVIIAHGQVVAEGTPDELRAQTGEANLEDAFVKAIGTEEGLIA